MIVFLVIGCSRDYSNNLHDGIDLLLKEYDAKDIRLLVGYNHGGYTEFRGIKSYLDPRAEVFLKANNGQKDIFKELYKLSEKKYFEKKVAEYGFTHVLVDECDEFYNYLDKSDDFTLFYKGVFKKGNNYKIFVRNDLLK